MKQTDFDNPIIITKNNTHHSLIIRPSFFACYFVKKKCSRHVKSTRRRNQAKRFKPGEKPLTGFKRDPRSRCMGKSGLNNAMFEISLHSFRVHLMTKIIFTANNCLREKEKYDVTASLILE